MYQCQTWRIEHTSTIHKNITGRDEPDHCHHNNISVLINFSQFFCRIPRKRMVQESISGVFWILSCNVQYSANIVVPDIMVFCTKAFKNTWQIEGVGEYLFRLVQLLTISGILATLRDFNTFEFLGIAQVTRCFTNKEIADTDEQYRLNTGGMYAVSRHPLYFFSIMLFLFEPVMTLYKFLILMWLVIYFHIGSIYEERRLLNEFGLCYAEYRERVSRIVPIKWIFN